MGSGWLARLVGVGVLGLAGCGPLGDLADARMNRVVPEPVAPVPAAHLARHRALFVADLHADTLLWDRDLLRRGRWGHVDVPRLREGGVDLQAFIVVTKTPGTRAGGGPGGRDCIPADGLNLSGLLAVAFARPPATWGDLRARALEQARRLAGAAERSRVAGGTELVLIRDADDLARVVAGTMRGEDLVGAVLGLEGGSWIGGPGMDDAAVRAEIALLFDAGFRLFAPTHRFDNALGGASEGCAATGLTPAGEVAVREAERRGMVVDLAHASPATLRDALRVLAHPVVITHVGVQAGCVEPCAGPRNLSDEELVALARHDAVIGIGFWPEAVGPGRGNIVRAMGHAAAVIGAAGLDPWAHLAFGSDFDGAVSSPFDATGLPSLTQALLVGREGTPGIPDSALARVAGANVCRLLALRLPGGGPGRATAICGGLR